MEGSHSEANGTGRGTGSAFRPGKSRGSVGAGKLNVFKPGMSQHSQFSQNADVENGIHIMTVEERFEEGRKGDHNNVHHLHTLNRQESEDFQSTHENEKERMSSGDESRGNISGSTVV